MTAGCNRARNPVLGPRNAIPGIVLRQAELTDRLERVNRGLSASRSVSHDLRAPFRHIVGHAELPKEIEGGRFSEGGPSPGARRGN